MDAGASYTSREGLEGSPQKRGQVEGKMKRQAVAPTGRRWWSPAVGAGHAGGEREKEEGR